MGIVLLHSIKIQHIWQFLLALYDVCYVDNIDENLFGNQAVILLLIYTATFVFDGVNLVIKLFQVKLKIFYIFTFHHFVFPEVFPLVCIVWTLWYNWIFLLFFFILIIPNIEKVFAAWRYHKCLILLKFSALLFFVVIVIHAYFEI
jgi:hypothetical protein